MLDELIINNKKINLLVFASFSQDTFDKIVKHIPYLHIIGIKNRVNLISVFNDITLRHINEGIVLICDKNYILNKIDFSLKSYINKTILRQKQFFNGDWDNMISITHNNKRKQIHYEKIIEKLKLNSRGFKIEKLKDITDKRLHVHYNIILDSVSKDFEFIIRENDINMSWVDFDSLDDIKKRNIINTLYHKELNDKFKHSILNISYNFYK